MSLQTWKEEFYPISAQELVDKPNVTDAEIIQHSLTKWAGLRKDNLDRHGVSLKKWADSQCEYLYLSTPIDHFHIDSLSCALCEKFVDPEEGEHNEYGEELHECRNCPLYQHLGNSSCDATNRSPFGIFQNTEDPEPMIDALTQTLKNME